MAKRNIIITGGAGFIGSHVVRLFVNKYPDYNIINLDKLTYAGNLANLKDVEDKPNYKFVKMDICDFEAIYRLMQDEKIDGIIHLAAESHSTVRSKIRLPSPGRMSWVHYHSCRLPNSTGRVCLRGMQANASTISLPTRFTERSK